MRSSNQAQANLALNMLNNLGIQSEGCALLTVEESFARVITSFTIFLQFCDENTMKPDAAVEALENLALDLQGMSKKNKDSIAKELISVSSEFSDNKKRHYVRSLPESLGIA